MPLRILIAGLLIAAAVGGGLWLHGYRQRTTYDPMANLTGSPYRVQVKPAWTDPVALGGGILALAIGAALIVGGRPRIDR